METNIYPNFIDATEQVRVELNQYSCNYINQAKTLFVGLLSSVFALVLISMALIIKQLKEIKKTRIQSLSLYSQLKIKDVKLIVVQITQFLTLIQE